MKRYYITRVVGTGTYEDPYSSELRVYIIDSWPDEPKFTRQVIAPHVILWAVMCYDLSDLAHTDVMTLTGIFSFPSGSLDTIVGDIAPAKRQEMRTKLENIGFDFTWANTNTMVREILKYLNRSIQLASWGRVPISSANFDLNTIVGDVPLEARQRINQHMINLGIDTSWITLTHTIGDVVYKIQRHDDGSMRLLGTVKKRQWLFQDTD